MARESHQLAWVGRGVTEAARSEGIQRAIQTYHQRAPRAKQDTTTGRECFRGGSERHRTHGQQEAASNTGHPPGWGREARPKAGTPFRTKKNFGSVAKINFKLIILPTTSFFFFTLLEWPLVVFRADWWNPAPTPGRWSAVQRAGSCAAPRLQQGASLVFVLGGVSRAGRCADAVLSLVVARNGDGRAQHRKAAGC